MIGKRKRIRRQLHAAQKKKGGDPMADPVYLASCYGKIRRNKEDKETALAGRPSYIEFYKCKYCRWYHIGRRRSDGR